MENLEAKFAELLGWERRKRREQTLISVGCFAAALAIVVSPFNVYLPNPGCAGSPLRRYFSRWRRGFSTARAGGATTRRGLWSNWTKRSASTNAPSPPGNCRAQGNSGRGAAGFASSRRKAPCP